MPVVPPSGGGIAGHQAQLTAGGRRVDAEGQGPQAVHACATTAEALCPWSPWRLEPPCPVVALASPGVAWRPVSHVLVRSGAVRVGHAPERRRRPGQQTAKAAARWMAARWAPGLRRPRGSPPPVIRALRDLRRPRVAVIHRRAQAPPRGVNGREEPPLQRPRVVADRCGHSGRRRLAA
jgi:hypothetical protein